MSQEEPKIPERVKVTSYPKIIFLWPTWIISFIFWIYEMFGGAASPDQNSLISWIWIIVFTFNLFVVTFDFAAGKFLLVVLLLLALAVIFLTGIIPTYALPTMPIDKFFYLVITIIFTIIYGLLLLSRQFNYLEVTSQQITYHVGIFADERRYPAPSVRFEKKTEDVFERLMPPFCAKLVLKTEGGESAEIMETVPMINTRLSAINKILEHLKVQPMPVQRSSKKED